MLQVQPQKAKTNNNKKKELKKIIWMYNFDKN